MSAWFEERERPGRLDFWRIYEAHYHEVSSLMVDAFSTDATLSRVFDEPEVVVLRDATRELVRRGIEEGNWAAYEARLRASALAYARLGLTVERWYELTVCLADVVTPRLIAAYGREPERLNGALSAMRRFLDRIRVVLTTEFIAAKEADLAESEKQMRALAGKLQSAIEEERTRMAREIHDELGQQLTTLKLDESWVRRRFETRNRTGVAERLADMDRLLDRTVVTVRRIAANLRPDILDRLGLLAALEWQAREVEARSGLRVDVVVPEEELSLPDAQATAIFRMFQEILTNVVRHACAKNVCVRLAVSAGAIVLDVRDDGRGITAAEAASGKSLGLLGMRERAALLGGRIDVDGEPGRGTTVRVQVPLHAADAS